MDNLLRPCADLGVQADSLIEWRYDAEKQVNKQYIFTVKFVIVYRAAGRGFEFLRPSLAFFSFSSDISLDIVDLLD